MAARRLHYRHVYLHGRFSCGEQEQPSSCTDCKSFFRFQHPPAGLVRSLTFAKKFVALGGFSVGFLELVHIVMVGLCCEPDDIGLASGLLASIRQVTGTVAGKLNPSTLLATVPNILKTHLTATIYVVILQNRVPVEMKADVVPAAVANGLPQSSIPLLFEAISSGTAATLDAVPGMTSKIEAAVAAATTQAYTSSFKTVYLASISFGVLSVVAALCTQNVEKFMTGQVARQLQGKAQKTDGEENIHDSKEV